jgi:hypothetical protein
LLIIRAAARFLLTCAPGAQLHNSLMEEADGIGPPALSYMGLHSL